MNKNHYPRVLICLLILVALFAAGLNVSPPPVIASTLTVTVATPTTATIGTPYTLTPTASGGTPLYTWSTVNKPFWLSLDASTGVMTGTPGVSATTVTFTLQVKDSLGVKATQAVTINVVTPPTPTLNVATPTTATIEIPYTLTPTASGGTPPYTWSTVNKPSWLSLDASTGVMTGTPGVSATMVTFTLQVKDSIGSKATASVTINVVQPPAPTLIVATPTTAIIGVPYTLTPTASGGTLPYTWSTVNKPFWLSLDASTGVMTGTPGVSAATVTFTLQVKDSIGSKATASVTINVNPVDPAVNFPDPALQAAIRKAINKPTGDIYASELLVLTQLDASRKWVENLAGLEYCTNLTSLMLWEESCSHCAPGDLADLTPLSGLKQLTKLNLMSNHISDVTPLAGLTNLTELELSHNWIGNNLTPLAGLTSLQTLGLGANGITDPTPLASLNNLTELNLNDNRISDLAPLAVLTNLQSLGVEGNYISNLTPLSGLTKLTSLNLCFNGQISDLTPLTGLTNLDRLLLRYDGVSDLAPLVNNAGLGAGDYLDLVGNPLSSTSLNTYIPALQARGVDVEL